MSRGGLNPPAWWIGVASWAARVLIRLYPADYRELLGADMHAMFVRECGRVAVRGASQSFLFSIRTLLGFFGGAARARVHHAIATLRRGRDAHRPRAGGIDRLLLEARHAARRLRRSPGFTAATVLTLGLGIGGSAAMFTMVNRILLQPLPYPNAGRIVALAHSVPGLGLDDGGQSWATYDHYRTHARTLEHVALHQEAIVNVTGGGVPRRLSLSLVTPSLFAVLGTGPLLGRVLDAGDAVPGAGTVVLIGERLWRDRYGGDPAIVGRTVEVNGRAREIVGVLPERFDYPTTRTEMWMNLPDEGTGPVDDLFRTGVGLVAAGRSVDDVRAELNALSSDFARMSAQSSVPFDQWRLTPVVEPLRSALVHDAASLLWILFGAVGVVLVVAGVNITTLFLVRAADRRHEIEIRRALGAVNRDTRRFFWSEALLLSTGAGVLGVSVAVASLRFATAWGGADLPRLHEVRPDAWTLMFIALLTVVVGMVVARVTTRFAHRPRFTGMAARHVGLARSDRNAHRVVVGFQVAMAFALLVGAGLLLQSFSKLRRVDLGFDPSNVLTFDVSLPFGRYPTYDDARRFVRAVVEGADQVPGVAGVAAVSRLPLADPSWTPRSEQIEAASSPITDAPPNAEIALVTENYFDVLRIPIREGVPPGAAAVPRPVYLSAPLARRLFGDRTAVGERVRRVGDNDLAWTTVAGVVGPVRGTAVHQPPTDILYLPLGDIPSDSQFAPRAMTVVVRAVGAPLDHVPAMRGLVAGLDPALSISNVAPFARTVAMATARWNFAATLMTAAAATTLLLGIVGLYALLSFAVARRRHEIGIRMALGAGSTSVRWMVVRQAGAIALAGLSAGFFVAMLGTRLLRGLLYDLTPNDPATFALTAGLIMAVAIVAGDVPARRAARVDPTRVLRGD